MVRVCVFKCVNVSGGVRSRAEEKLPKLIHTHIHTHTSSPSPQTMPRQKKKARQRESSSVLIRETLSPYMYYCCCCYYPTYDMQNERRRNRLDVAVCV